MLVFLCIPRILGSFCCFNKDCYLKKKKLQVILLPVEVSIYGLFCMLNE